MALVEKIIKLKFLNNFNFFNLKNSKDTKIEGKEWEKIIISINEIIYSDNVKKDILIRDFIEKSVLKGKLDIDLYIFKKRIEVSININGVKFIYHEDCRNLLDGEWFSSDSRVTKLNVTWINCEFIPCDHSYSNLPIKCSVNDTGLVEKTIIEFKRCDFTIENLDIRNIDNCYFTNSKITNLIDSSGNKKWVFRSTTVAGISISQFLQSLQFFGSKINYINISELLKKNDLVHFVFDKKSEMTSSGYIYYRKMRQLIDTNILKDPAQSYILYNKELTSFSQGGQVDDKILLFLNKIINEHGTSFVRPIALMYILNLFFIICLNISILQISEINYFEVIEKSLYMAMDISPLNEFIYNLSDKMHGVDGLRRVLLTILTYSTISAAVRFKFKVK